MKTIITPILLLSLLIMSSIGIAQDAYTQKMQENLLQFQKVESLMDYQRVALGFEQIASVETEKWEPLYYQAHAYIMMSFMATDSSARIRDTYLDQADAVIKKMIEIAPKESEVYALQALAYTATLVVDPMSRSAKYTPLTERAIQTSLALDPNNPRAKQIKLSNDFGYAQFFGKDLSSFCDEAQAQLTAWEKYPQKGVFYPIWGKGQLQGIVKQSCGDSTPKENATPTPDNTNTTTGNTITVNIKKLPSNEGVVMMELLDENEHTVSQSMAQVSENTATLTFDQIPEGTYAIRFFHDTNGNQKMDSSKRGIPTESYGFSNNARGFMGPPKYKKMLFTVSTDTELTLKAR